MNKLEQEQQFERELKAALYEAMENEIVGERLDPMLAERVKTLIRGMLLPHGLSKARIEVGAVDGGLAVKVTLPPEGPRVGVIQLHVDTGGPF